MYNTFDVPDVYQSIFQISLVKMHYMALNKMIGGS